LLTKTYTDSAVCLTRSVRPSRRRQQAQAAIARIMMKTLVPMLLGYPQGNLVADALAGDFRARIR
jgi:hypothetical protein